jgi:hypothetical protein
MLAFFRLFKKGLLVLIALASILCLLIKGLPSKLACRELALGFALCRLVYSIINELIFFYVLFLKIAKVFLIFLKILNNTSQQSQQSQILTRQASASGVNH